MRGNVKPSPCYSGTTFSLPSQGEKALHSHVIKHTVLLFPNFNFTKQLTFSNINTDNNTTVTLKLAQIVEEVYVYM